MWVQSFCGKDEGFHSKDEGFHSKDKRIFGKDKRIFGKDKGFFNFLHLHQKSFVFTNAYFTYLPTLSMYRYTNEGIPSTEHVQMLHSAYADILMRWNPATYMTGNTEDTQANWQCLHTHRKFQFPSFTCLWSFQGSGQWGLWLFNLWWNITGGNSPFGELSPGETGPIAMGVFFGRGGGVL